MNVLWIALGIYIAGVALVLFLRPTLMFRSGSGAWKEFGLGRGGSGSDDYTLFPFWMFALAWAVISYAAATLLAVFLVSSNIPEVAVAAANIATPISTAPPPTLPTSIAASPIAPATTQPGFYILETPPSGAPPRYVYFGDKPPTAANIDRFGGTIG
jgi:hypothetical protein